MFAPGAALLADEFHITSSTVVTLTVSIYLCGFALGPMFIAPLSELYGRLVIYHACNVVYIGFIIGCALGKDTAMFLAFRFLAGCAASGREYTLNQLRGTANSVISIDGWRRNDCGCHPATSAWESNVHVLCGPTSGTCMWYRLSQKPSVLTFLQGHGPDHRWVRVRNNRLAMDVLDPLHHGKQCSPALTPSLLKLRHRQGYCSPHRSSSCVRPTPQYCWDEKLPAFERRPATLHSSQKWTVAYLPANCSSAPLFDQQNFSFCRPSCSFSPS